ncbi:MAG: hypothetical protein ACLFN4_03780 [Candidatus Acetothermia bacterium]
MNFIGSAGPWLKLAGRALVQFLVGGGAVILFRHWRNGESWFAAGDHLFSYLGPFCLVVLVSTALWSLEDAFPGGRVWLSWVRTLFFVSGISAVVCDFLPSPFN